MLDKGPGREREAFLSALVPLLGPSGRSGTHGLPPGARLRRFVMHHKLATAVTSFAGLCAVTWLATHAWGADPARERELALASVTQQTPRAAAAPTASAAPARAPARDASASASGEREHLEAGWVLRGRAFDDRGGLGGAALVGRVYSGTKKSGAPLLEQHFTADAAGDFAWALTPPSEPITIEVSNAAIGSGDWVNSSWFMPGDPAPTDWFIAVTVDDSRVRGTVRGPDGAPIAGARVGTSLDGRRFVESGADGTYTLPCSSLRKLRDVYAWREGFAPAGIDGGTLTTGGELVRDFTLTPEVRWSGRVLDEEGAPLAGASVWIEDQSVDETVVDEHMVGGTGVRKTTHRALDGWPKAITDAAGRYELGGVHPQASRVVLSARATGFAEASLSSSPSPERTGANCDLHLVRGVSVSGRVLADGAPVAWAWVALGDTDYGHYGQENETWTDADGRFTLGGVPKGAHYLRAWRRGHAALRHDLVVQASGPALELELAASHSLGGVVLGPDSVPLPWASVYAADASADGIAYVEGFQTYTDDEGRFTFVDLPLRRIQLGIGAKGCEFLKQDVGMPDHDDLVLRLVAAPPAPGSPPPPPAPIVPVTAASGHGHLEGLLLDLAGSGRPQQTLVLAAVESAVGELVWHATTDEHGHYAFDALPAGTLRVAWEQHEAGLTVLDLEQLVTVGAEEFRTLDLQPHGRATLRGTLGFRQTPMPNSVTVGYGTPPARPPLPEVVAVRILPDAESPSLPPWTQRGIFAHGGQFELEGLEPGDYTAVVNIRIESQPAHLYSYNGSYGVHVPLEGVATVEMLFQ
jgi:hypothetical protein